MPIPPALADYKSEAHLIDEFLIPLFIRLGFLSVLNYHGSREYGKDLVILEYDKLGNAIYHGVQAKHVASLPMSSVENLVQDVNQAFVNSFKHPLTGEHERVSRVFIVNSGTISDQAREHFYNSLSKFHGANVVLIDGKALLALAQQAIYTQQVDFRRQLSGLAAEILVNDACLRRMHGVLSSYNPNRIVIPALVLRLVATNAVLASPSPALQDFVFLLEEYWQTCNGIDVLLHGLRDPAMESTIRDKDVRMCMQMVERARDLGTVVNSRLRDTATEANISLDDEIQPFVPATLGESMVSSHSFASARKEDSESPHPS